MNETDFIENVQNLGITLSKIQLNKLKDYYKLLKLWNDKFNLTTILDEQDVYLKHFYDSVCIFKTNKFKDNMLICDIGTGAGFPGIVIAIINNNLRIDLVESNKKKCTFLNEVKEKLDLNNITIINSRAEEYGKNNREKYDIVTCRAVSRLYIISELAIPLLKVKGYFLPLKANLEEELDEAKKHLRELDANIEDILLYDLPIIEAKRTIPVIKKNKPTNNIYPREYSKIIKVLKKN